MKIAKYLIVQNADNQEISKSEFIISDKRFYEVFGFSPSEYKAPYLLKLNSSLRNHLSNYLNESFEERYVTVEWREVPESEQERKETIKRCIRIARKTFTPSDEEINSWIKEHKVSYQWNFEKYIKEENFLMAVESLHAMTQCFYGSPFNDSNIIKNLNEARRMCSENL